MKTDFDLPLEDRTVSFNILRVNFVSIAVEEKTKVTNRS